MGIEGKPDDSKPPIQEFESDKDGKPLRMSYGMPIPPELREQRAQQNKECTEEFLSTLFLQPY